MLLEIEEMPLKAKSFLQECGNYSLPFNVPYIGMGSSFFAPLAFKYMGFPIYPELASEYFNYLKRDELLPYAVLLSQSGRSTEVLWCAPLFEKCTAISNTPQSPLCQFENVNHIVSLRAGQEEYSSSKTYINTLLALFKGFQVDVIDAVALLETNFEVYRQKGKEMAELLFETIYNEGCKSIYITGSGPNIGTALQAALILSESTKLNFNGLPMAQYDHGPKETAKGSVVFNIISNGKSYERTVKLEATLKAAGAKVFSIEEPYATENESILHNIIPFNFMAYYLSELLQVPDTFLVGGKVTEVV